jgi:hypothetical protein
MKKRAILIATVLACCSYGFIVKSNIKKSKFTLQELIQDPMVLVKITSNGKYTGASVSIEIESKFSKSITIEIPQGTLFYPENEKEQTLVLPKTELITLNKKSTQSFIVNGYCSESSDKCPNEGGVFKIGNSKNKKLKQLFAYLNTNNFDNHQIQESIWCITDDKSIGNINEEEDTKLKETVARITGGTIPWQSTRREITVDENQNIVSEPVEITGQIKFGTKRITKVKSKIIRENGELIHEFSKVMTIPKADDITFNFHVKVKGWEHGKYFVVYFTDLNKELVKQEFTL